MTFTVSCMLLIVGVCGVHWVHKHESRARMRAAIIDAQRLSGPRWSLIPVSPRGKIKAIDYDPSVGDHRVDPTNDIALPSDAGGVN